MLARTPAYGIAVTSVTNRNHHQYSARVERPENVAYPANPRLIASPDPTRRG